MPGQHYTAVPTPEEEHLWQALIACQGQAFRTARGLAYTYAVRGNELFFSRKGKSITRATVNMAYHTAQRLQAQGLPVNGPKKLGTFGASYLYPVFIALGFIRLPALPESPSEGAPG